MAKRKADEERAEAFNRAFFGTSDKMEQERIQEEMWKKRRKQIQEENAKKLKTCHTINGSRNTATIKH